MLEHDLLVFIRKLNQLGAPYMVTGSWATTLYGKPRMTYDVDIIIHLESAQLLRLPELFPLEEFYCPPLDVLRKEAQRPRGQFNLIHHPSGFKADIYIRKEDPLDLWGFQNRRSFAIAGESVWAAPPEYVILGKLEFFRQGGSQKHLRDIRVMLEVSSDTINRADLERWIRERGLDAEWAAAQRASD
jgi:hypothetical protein